MENNIFCPPPPGARQDESLGLVDDDEDGRRLRRNTRDAVPRSNKSSMPPHSQEQFVAHDNTGPDENLINLRAGASLQPQSASWESNSMNSNREEEDDDIISSDYQGRSGHGDNEDRRKYVDLTTPTLVDEDDDYYDEQEMISLEQERLLRTSHMGGEYVYNKDDSHLRRTPGANMYASSFEPQTNSPGRRTPGASAMHLSAVEKSNVVAPVDDSVLTFGLNLSTPADNQRIEEGESSSLSSSSASKKMLTTSQKVAIKMNDGASQQDRDIHSYTPAGWTLSRNPNLDVVHGAFSPNTFRLTQTLDNLLLDDDEGVSGPYDENKKDTRGGVTNDTQLNHKTLPQFFKNTLTEAEHVMESWTESFIISNDGDKATRNRMQKFTSGRNRRGRREVKRNRNVTSTMKFDPPKTGNDIPVLRPQHPKPLRQQQGAPGLVMGFLVKEDPSEAQEQNYPSDEEPSSPPPLNFGGAFAPPTQESVTNFRRPVASRGPNYEASTVVCDTPSIVKPSFSCDNHSTDSVGYRPQSRGEQRPVPVQQHRHYSTFGENQPPPPIFGPNHLPPSQMIPPPASPLHFHPPHPPPAFDYHTNQMYSAPPTGMSSNSAMSTASVSPYPLSVSPYPSSVSPYPTEYSGGHSQSQPPQLFAPIQGQQPLPPPPPPPPQNFAPIPWQQQMPIHFDTNVAQREAPWRGTPTTGWDNPRTEFGYGPAPQMADASSRMGTSQTPPVTTFQERDASREFDHLHFSTNYQRIHHGNDLPPFPAHPQTMHNEEHILHPTYSRPRGRSVDSLSPADLPPTGRGRMQTWDGGHESQAQCRKENQRHRPATKRHQKSQQKSKKTISSADDLALQRKKKNPPPSPKKKKPSTTENTNGSKQKVSLLKGKKMEIVLESDGRLSPSEDPEELKRAELNESPSTRLAFKSFQRNFRIRERASYQEAEELARQHLNDESLPENVRWRVHLELADLCKRSNRFDEARKLYRQVCELQPYASQGWLEYSKLEEECGHMKKSAEILHCGLKYCEVNESLLSRAIKIEEKIGNVGKARQLLARLKHEGIEKVWRTVLEGALLESRAGNVVTARRVLKYLMHHIPWYGPLYFEAFKLERDLGHSLDALAIVERGLKAIPSYGPLWFGAFRISEVLELSENAFDIPRTLAMVERATESISRELVWKVHLECAQILERAAIESISGKKGVTLNDFLTPCRKRFALTALMCPSNLRWKVWLAGGRMELLASNTEKARMLFRKAYDVVPDKGRSLTLLECARLEEFAGDTEAARAILCKARSEFGSDWKVWLESVLLEIRDRKRRRATQLATMALAVHPGTGRLWATLVQLRMLEGEDVQYNTLKLALSAVPKSGEVWCEGARIQLNPYSLTFDLEEAHRRLFFATKFTPQYGDSFVEIIRLELLDKWIVPIATSLWNALKGPFLADITVTNSDKTYHLIVQCVLNAMRSLGETPTASSDFDDSATINTTIDPDLVLSLRSRLEQQACNNDVVDLSDLELRCANADPNYGLLWFHCRRGPSDTARTILSRAKEKIVSEMSNHAHIYIAAVIRRAGIAAALKSEIQRQTANTIDVATNTNDDDSNNPVNEDSGEWHKLLDARLLASPSIDDMLSAANKDEKVHVKLLEGSTSGSDFITGLVESNTFTPLERLPLFDRREILFGSDSLLS